MYSWMEVLGQWKDGIIYPRWAALAHWGYGEARFVFYPPASWTFGAALGAVLPWKVVPGVYCWIVLALAGAAMYQLARHWLTAEDALFAAVFYAVNPYHLMIIYWRSAFAELLAAVLLPLLLLCLLQIKESTSSSSDSAARENHKADFRPTLWLSLVLAAAWLTNVPAAVMIHYSVAGLALAFVAIETVREVDHRGSRRLRIGRPLVRMTAAIFLGAGLAAFYLLPAIYEQGWINLKEVLAPGVRPQDNYLFTMTSDPDHNRFNLLISTIAIAEIVVVAFAIWFSRRWRSKDIENAYNQSPWLALSTWAAGSGLLMLWVSNLLWEYLPKLRYVQLPFRWLLCMNAALALLLTMATKRWTSRILVYVALVAVIVIAGYRTQPPWWDTAADVREMSDAMADGTGYEGTDEYVPAGDDPYELNKDLSLVSNDKGAPVPSDILAWGPTEKHFRVRVVAAQNLTLRLFNYPAWKVAVNGRPVPSGSTEVTGLIVVPINAGDNDVYVRFRRTKDRFLGDILSAISIALFILAWMSTRPKIRLGRG